MRHVIRTQVMDVTTDSAADSFGLQHKLSSLYYRVILPLLEKTLNELAPGDQTIYLDSIGIDMGVISPDELDKNNWPEKLRDTLYKQLKEAIQIQRIKESPEKMTASVSQQWLYYMQHGFLPWNVLNTDEQWYNKVLEELAGNYHSIGMLRNLVRYNSPAVCRISLLHSQVYLGHLVEALTAQKQAALVRLMITIEKMLNKYEQLKIGIRTPGAFIATIWERILLLAASEEGAISENEIIQKTVLTSLGKMQLIQLLREEEVISLLHPFVPSIKEQLARQSNRTELLSEEREYNRWQKDGKTKIPEEGIFVKYAGLVILHPFLNQLFNLLDLSGNGKFGGNDVQGRALSILHYLATGPTNFEEHEAVVHKILCGYPLDTPIERDIQLTDEEMSESMSLLEMIIARWSILKNSSVAALQETFLQRSGKLVNMSNGDIRLMVEADALDVLLDHLPWGLNMIKLPWMPQLLRVEWK